MDDYRDIGAKDFERYEKIRARISDLVEFFNLVTNSTPGTLRIDPVQVVYDLASSSTIVNLQPETQQFKRQVIETSGSVAIGATDTVFFPIVNGAVPLTAGNGRVERLTALYIEIESVGASASECDVAIFINDGSTTSPNGLPLMRLESQGSAKTQKYYVAASLSLLSPGAEEPYPSNGLFPFAEITVGENQNMTFEVANRATASDPCNYDIRAQYEYFEP